MTHTKKERVLIDVDGVLRDYVSSLNAVYLREFPDHTIDPVTDWALEHFYPIGKEIYQFMDGQFAREILENAPAYPGEIDALRQFENDFEIVIVTAQPPAHRYPTMVWLGKNDVPANEIHIEHEKQRVPGLALLDDFTVNLEKFQKTGRLAVCLDRPWNQQWKGPRVRTVAEFFALLKAFQSESGIDSDTLLA
ncbi:MAG: hypothetical protein R3C26_18440 [Calditrichia bacterium]